MIPIAIGFLIIPWFLIQAWFIYAYLETQWAHSGFVDGFWLFIILFLAGCLFITWGK